MRPSPQLLPQCIQCGSSIRIHAIVQAAGGVPEGRTFSLRIGKGGGACRLHSDGRSCRCGRNCLRRLLYGARLWPRCRNVITRYNTFASVICKVQWTLRSLSEGGVSCGKTTIKKLDKLQITCAVRTAYERMNMDDKNDLFLKNCLCGCV